MDLQAYIGQLEKRMREAAGNLEFEEAARLRDEIRQARRMASIGIGHAACHRAAPPGSPRLAVEALAPRAEKAAEDKTKSRRRVGR